MSYQKKLSGTENWLKKKIMGSFEHQKIAFDTINELVIKARDNREVVLVDDTRLTDFISCSYLGLDQDKRVVEASVDSILQNGVNFAVARTRMKIQSFVILEELLNKIFCGGYSTTFSSLHVAHLGILPLLGSGEMPSFPIDANGIVFILDKTAHASLQVNRGLMEQFGEVIVADFQKLDILDTLFASASQNKKTPIVVGDSIGSMGGVAPVEYLFELADKFNGYIYLDDAHATSVYGMHGCGYILDTLYNQFHPRLILAASLSKGFGTNGGVVVVPTKEDEKMLKHFATTYVFGNPLPLAIVDAAIASAKIHLSDEIITLQNLLRKNIAYFDSCIESVIPENLIINYKSFLPIRGIFVGDELKIISYVKSLMKRGYLPMAAMYPTVAKGKSILRITLSAVHKEEEILGLCDAIKEIFCSEPCNTANLY